MDKLLYSNYFGKELSKSQPYNIAEEHTPFSPLAKWTGNEFWPIDATPRQRVIRHTNICNCNCTACPGSWVLGLSGMQAPESMQHWMRINRGHGSGKSSITRQDIALVHWENSGTTNQRFMLLFSLSLPRKASIFHLKWITKLSVVSSS